MSVRSAFFLALVTFAALLLSSSRLRGGTIRGTITTDNDKPIQRVEVTVQRRSDNRWVKLASTTTDERGEFQLDVNEPGNYRVHAEKKGWKQRNRTVRLSGETAREEVNVNFVMKLTLLYQLLWRFQIGSILYVLVFGLLVLCFNFFMVPEPSKGVTVFGWIVLLGILGIAAVKIEWHLCLLLATISVPSAVLIQRYGNKTAATRLHGEQVELQKEKSTRKQEKDQLTALIGEQGITLSDLKTYGRADIIGNIVTVRALRGYVPKDTPVVVKMLDGTTPVVEPSEQHEAV
jgi:5-hydroxyisourate hydrolase-like protein (transthyretin family)